MHEVKKLSYVNKNKKNDISGDKKNLIDYLDVKYSSLDNQFETNMYTC